MGSSTALLTLKKKSIVSKFMAFCHAFPPRPKSRQPSSTPGKRFPCLSFKINPCLSWWRGFFLVGAEVLQKMPCRNSRCAGTASACAAVRVGWRGLMQQHRWRLAADAAPPQVLCRRRSAGGSPVELLRGFKLRINILLAIQPCPNRSFSSGLRVSRFMLVSAPSNLLREKLAG